MDELNKYNVILDHVRTSQHPNTRTLFIVQAKDPDQAAKKARAHGEQMHFVFGKGWEISRCDGGPGDARMRRLFGEPIYVAEE